LAYTVNRNNGAAIAAALICVERAWDETILRPIFFIMKTEVSNISVKELLINEDIRDKEVRLIGADGAQLGIMNTRDALALATEKNLDLVKIAPQATPPVCRIMDYGKYRFEQAKREKEARKNQRVIEIKEIRLSLNIDVGDLNTKVKQATKFLKEGNKLKVSIRFRGREMAHPELGNEVMNRFAGMIAEFGTVEKPPKLEGRHMLMFVAAKQPAK
jgi:translation initiation factor IF-3